ncbi:unnamed protein product, partial [Choristocarpus tenellus]
LTPLRAPNSALSQVTISSKKLPTAKVLRLKLREPKDPSQWKHVCASTQAAATPLLVDEWGR